MKFEHIRVMNFENAFRGMRHPKESYHLSDSEFGLHNINYLEEDFNVVYDWTEFLENEEKEAEIDEWLIKNGVLYKDDDYIEYAFLGPNDLRLAQQLISGGSEHRKFMRQIFVSVDITAPLYWWKEFDTYKVGTVANSTSTMHKIQFKPITMESFELDDFEPTVKVFDIPEYGCWIKDQVQEIVNMCETLRQKYNETKDVKYWKELIRWLPEGWLQTRTITMNYENLLGMCSSGQRRFHKLNEWSGTHTEVDESFMQFARSLPYAQELIFMDELKSEKMPLVDFS